MVEQPFTQVGTIKSEVSLNSAVDRGCARVEDSFLRCLKFFDIRFEDREAHYYRIQEFRGGLRDRVYVDKY